MLDTNLRWSQEDATAYEATQELLTKVMALYQSKISNKDCNQKEGSETCSVLIELEHLKKTISPTTPTLYEIRKKYRQILRSLLSE